MIALGLSDRNYKGSALRVVGHRPLLCPPRIPRHVLWPNWTIAEFVYIDLHGVPGDPEWLYADGERVLHIGDVDGLPQVVVFATTCHLQETDFYDIFRRDHTLICGDGRNYGERDRAIGAPLLALWFRRAYGKTRNAELALHIAKARVALTSWARSSDRDALKFYIAPHLMGRQGE